MTHITYCFLSLLLLASSSISSELVNVKRAGLETASYRLNNGLTMPALGFGTSKLGNSTTTKNSIKTAILTGYRLIDTATRYDNEAEIGDALEELFQKKIISRDDIFITTKVWPNSFTKSLVLESIRGSLKRLKLDYLDLVLLHFPAGFRSGNEPWPIFDNGTVIPLTWNKNGFIETWKAMEEAVKLNLTDSIGVSNFNQEQMDVLMQNSEIKPVVNQVECNPVFNQKDLLSNHKRHKVILQAYAPIGRASPKILTNNVLQSIGSKYNKTSTQVAIRWLLEREAALVVKSSNPKHISTNLNVFDFSLNPNEMDQIDQIEQEPRAFKFAQARNHPDFPFKDHF